MSGYRLPKAGTHNLRLRGASKLRAFTACAKRSNGGEWSNTKTTRTASSQRVSPVFTLATSLAHASAFEFTTLDLPEKYSPPFRVAAYVINDDGATVNEFNMGTVNPGLLYRDRPCSQGNRSTVFVAKLGRNGCRLHDTAERARVTMGSAASWRA